MRGSSIACAVLVLAAAGCGKGDAPAPAPSPAPAPAPGPGGAAGQGVLLRMVPDAAFGTFSVYDAQGSHRLVEACAPDALVPLEPARYLLRDKESYVPYGTEVEVKPGQATEVRVGALRLIPVDGAAFTTWSIYDAQANHRLREYNEPGKLVGAGAGRYQLRDKDSYVPYGTDVEVKPGEITEVRIGALKLIPVEGAAFATWSIYDAQANHRLREYNEPGVVVSAGPGRYQLRDKDSYVPYGTDIVVKAGEVTEVRTGALKLIPVEGADHATWSIYDAQANHRLREFNEPGALVSAGAGRYQIRDKETYVVYGADVVVKPGEVTVVNPGAIRGPAVAWSIYDAQGNHRLRETCEPGALVSAGAGRYLLRDKASGKDLGTVEVKAGAVAEMK